MTKQQTPTGSAGEPQSITLNYGGQAVIEGVMMRGSKALSVAVRNPEGGIVVHTEPLDTRIYGGKLAKTPFLRGLTLLWDALGLGIKALMFSAEVAIEEEKEGGDEGKEPEKVFEGRAMDNHCPIPKHDGAHLFCCTHFSGQLD